MSFWDILKPPAPTKAKTPPKPPTSAELEAALAEAEVAARAAEEAAATVALERADLLLAADDATLDEVERRLQLTQREADRAAAAVEALRRRLADTEDAERAAAIDKIHADGAAALSDGLVAYGEYADLAPQVAALGRRMADA